MAIRHEINLRLPNSPGALDGVCRLLSDERVNILALSLDTGGQLRMVVDNHVHATATLRDHHHQVTERDVLFVSLANQVGALEPVLRLMAEGGVNVDYLYGGAGEVGGQPAIVVGVEDAQRASTAAGV
jgi:hypothetical protein